MLSLSKLGEPCNGDASHPGGVVKSLHATLSLGLKHHFDLRLGCVVESE